MGSNLPLGFALTAAGSILLVAGLQNKSVATVLLGGSATNAPAGSGSVAPVSSGAGGTIAGSGGTFGVTPPSGKNTTGTGSAFAYPLGLVGKIIGTPGVGTHAPGVTSPASWQSDNAVDISVPVGTPVYAPYAGVIGSQIGKQNVDQSGPLAGLRVYVNDATQSTFFQHLSKLNVKAGQTVEQGQLIGYTGSANGVAHLHLAVEHGNPLTIIDNLLHHTNAS